MTEQIRVVVDGDASQLRTALLAAQRDVQTFGNTVGAETRRGTAYNSILDQQRRNLNALGTVAKGTAAAGIGALAYAFYDTVQAGAEYEQKMSRVEAVSGANERQMRKLGNQAKQLGADTKFSASEAADGMYELSAAGFDVTETSKAIPGTLDLAAASNIELAQASEISANAIRGFGLEASASRHVADVLAQAVNSSSVEMDDLGLTMKYIGPIANATGQSFETMIAAVGEMGNAGIKGEQAGTTLRQALLSLTKPVGQAVDGLRMLGLETDSLQGPNGLLPLPQIIAKLEEGMDGLSKAEQNAALKMIFGQEAASGMFAVIEAGPEKLRKLTDELERSDGAADKAARTMQDNVLGAWEQLTGSIETTEIGLFETFEKPLQQTLEQATELVNEKGPELEAALAGIFKSPEFRRADLEGRFKIITASLAEAAQDAMPVIAEAMGKGAVEGAEAYVKGFAEANVWGKAALGALLVSKLGLTGVLFRSPGQQAATAYVESVAAGMTGAGATQALGRNFQTTAAGVLVPAGAEVGEQTAESMAQRTGSSFGKRLLAGGLMTAGLIGAMEALGTRGGVIDTIEGNGTAWGEVAGEAFVEKYGQQIEDGMKRAARGQQVDLGGGLILRNPQDFESASADLRRMAETLDDIDGMPPELAAQFDSMADSLERSGRQMASYDEKVTSNFNALRRGIFNSVADIDKAIRENERTIADRWPRGSERGREQLAKTFRLAADNVDKLVDRQVISVEEGERRKAELIRRSKVVNASEDQARRFGIAWARGMDDTKDFTGKGVDQIMRELGQMPEESREIAAKTWLNQLREAARRNPKLQDEFRDLRSEVVSEFGILRSRADRESGRMAFEVGANFLDLAGAGREALGNIRDNTNEALKAFGVKAVSYGLATAKKALKGHQTGGVALVPGTGDGDKIYDVVPHGTGIINKKAAEVLLEPGELKVAPEVVRQMGGPQTIHAINRALPRFQAGGMVDPAGPGTGVVNAAIADVVGQWSQRYDAAINYGYDPGGGHVSPGHNVTGTATDTGPAAGWGTGPTALFEDGLRAVLASGLQVLYGSHGVGTAYPNHGYGNHAHIEWGMHPQIKGIAAAVERIRRQVITGPDSPQKRYAQASIDEAWRSANEYLKAQSPDVWDNGGAVGKALSGPGQIVGASVYGFGEAGTGTVGASGEDLRGKMAYAELDMGTALGGLEFGHPLRITAPTGRSEVGEKLDIGAGGGDVDGHHRAIDLWSDLARALGLDGNFLGTVKVQGLQAGGIAGERGSGLSIPATTDRIEDLYRKLIRTDDPKRRRAIERTIVKKQRELKKAQGKKKRRKLDKIKKQGSMEGMRAEVAKRQLAADTLADYIGRLETQHGFTEQRDVSAILEEMGLDPDVELSSLNEDQRAALVGAVDADAATEEGERNSEIALNYGQLSALMSLRQQLLAAIEAAKERIERAERQIERAAKEEKEAEKEARKIERELQQLQRAREELRKDEPPKKRKNESAKDYQQRLKRWREDRDGRLTKLGDRMDKQRFALVQARTAASLAVGTREAARESRSGLIDAREEFTTSLTDLQGLGSTMDPNVKAIWPSGSGPAQFGGEILIVQDRLQALGATKIVKPTLDFTADEDSSSSDSDSERLRLELEAAMETIAGLRLGAAQTDVFQGMFGPGAPGLPYVGAFAHGTKRVPYTGMALVHQDEMITPDPEGPFGSQFAAPQAAPAPVIELTFADNSGQLVRLIDARVDGRAANVADRQIGRRQRQISLAPGR